jgi:hypothetical protein
MNTSYFGCKLLDRNHNLIPIAGLTPEWFKKSFPYVKIYKPLAPPKNLVFDYKKGKITKEDYIEKYNKQLEKLDPKKVYEDLKEDAILLCWEAPGKFCHRQLVAKWLEQNLNIEIREL